MKTNGGVFPRISQVSARSIYFLGEKRTMKAHLTSKTTRFPGNFTNSILECPRTPLRPLPYIKSVPEAAGRSARRTPPSVHGASDEAFRVRGGRSSNQRYGSPVKSLPPWHLAAPVSSADNPCSGRRKVGREDFKK